MSNLINEPRLDLACGDSKREGYKGLDISETASTDHIVDLQVFPWPIESESAEEVNCSHYVEHIAHDNIKGILKQSNSFEEFKEKFLSSKDGAIDFFNELYRIMKKGGKAYIQCPYYSSIRAFGDPTHRRYIGEFSFYYVNKEWRDNNRLSHYGLNCDFDVKFSYYITNDLSLKSEEVRNKSISHEWNVVDDLLVELTKR